MDDEDVGGPSCECAGDEPSASTDATGRSVVDGMGNQGGRQTRMEATKKKKKKRAKAANQEGEERQQV